MALKHIDKPMLPVADRIPCAAGNGCTFAGRLWVDGLGSSQRLCVDHYYRWVDENRGNVPIAPSIP